jgi:hypothetical protein
VETDTGRLYLSSIVTIGVACACFGMGGCAAEGTSGKLDATENQRVKRILPSEVNWSTNLLAFEAQVRGDLPTGIPKQEVEAYLSREKLAFFYVDYEYKTFVANLENIGVRLMFRVSLQIEIHLDESERVKQIEFHLHYL